MSAPNKIPESEYNERVKKLLSVLIARGRTNSSQETNELFQLYNDRNTPQENGTQCGACRSRVFQRMKRYYESIKGGIES